MRTTAWSSTSMTRVRASLMRAPGSSCGCVLLISLASVRTEIRFSRVLRAPRDAGPAGPLADRDVGPHGDTRTGVARQLELAAERLDALAHSHDAEPRGVALVTLVETTAVV